MLLGTKYQGFTLQPQNLHDSQFKTIMLLRMSINILFLKVNYG